MTSDRSAQLVQLRDLSRSRRAPQSGRFLLTSSRLRHLPGFSFNQCKRSLADLPSKSTARRACEQIGDPRVVPNFHCTFLPGMPSSPTRGVQHRYVPELRCRHGLRRLTPARHSQKFPQSVPRGLRISWLHWFASATACQVARPLYGSDWIAQPSGLLTSRLSTDQSPSPLPI